MLAADEVAHVHSNMIVNNQGFTHHIAGRNGDGDRVVSHSKNNRAVDVGGLVEYDEANNDLASIAVSLGQDVPPSRRQ